MATPAKKAAVPQGTGQEQTCQNFITNNIKNGPGKVIGIVLTFVLSHVLHHLLRPLSQPRITSEIIVSSFSGFLFLFLFYH